MPGPTELWVVLVIVLVLFGGRKIPEIMKGLGKGIKEFKNAKDEINETTKEPSKEIKEEVKEESKDDSKKA